MFGKACESFKFRSRGRFYAISYTLKKKGIAKLSDSSKERFFL